MGLKRGIEAAVEAVVSLKANRSGVEGGHPRGDRLAREIDVIADSIEKVGRTAS
jgi:hypothetical protein